MPESTTPAFAWVRTNVPPLRTDIDRRRRALRRALASELRAWALIGAGLFGTAVGALAAIQPENFIS